MTEKIKNIPLYLSPDQAELMMLDEIHPDSEAGRAILSRSKQRSDLMRPNTYEQLRSYSHPQPFRQTEIILNPVSVEAARTWFNASFYIAGSLAALAGSAYLLALAAAFVGANIVGVKLIVAVLLVVALIILVSKIKTTRRVIHEHSGEPTRTYNFTQNNYVK